MNQPDSPEIDELEEILEGYYRWCLDTVTDAYKLNRILGTGTASKLNPSEAKAALEAHISQRLKTFAEEVKAEMPKHHKCDKKCKSHSEKWLEAHKYDSNGWNNCRQAAIEAIDHVLARKEGESDDSI